MTNKVLVSISCHDLSVQQQIILPQVTQLLKATDGVCLQQKSSAFACLWANSHDHAVPPHEAR